MQKHPVKKSRRLAAGIKTVVIACFVGASFLFSSDTLSAQNPNVIFIGVDDLNNFTGFAGHPDAITPNMDRLASQGVHFPRAYCSYPLCGASRASLMTGVYFTELTTTRVQPEDEEVEQRIEALGSSLLHTYMGDRGYKTMAVGKILHRHVPDNSVDLSGGRDSFDSNQNAQGQRVRSNWPLDLNHDTATTLTDWGVYVGRNGVGTEADMGDTISADWAVERLQETHNDPFMLMVGFLHPHVPWYVPQKYYDMYDPADLTLPPYLPSDYDDISAAGFDLINDGFPTTEWAIAANEWRNILQAYLANVSYVDAQIGRVLDALDNSQYASNTVVVLWGDHGYHLGEKNIFQKNTLWDRSAVTPLIIKAPGMTAGVECNRVVSLLDVYPTLLDLCNLPPNDMNRGRSLTPLLQDPTLPWDFPAFTEHRGNNGVQYGNLRLITYADGTEELYDHAIDPNEQTNLVNSMAYADELATLQSMSPFPDDTAPGSAVFNFVNDGPLDAVGVGGNMTVNGVTITTQDVIGLDGTRASDGTGNETNIGNLGGLGINSAVSDTALLFQSDEGWEFTFNTDVQLQSIQLLQTNAGGTLTISSESFSDIVLAGEVDGDNDLGNTVVPANTLVSIFYSHTGPQGTDGPRILSLSVAMEVAMEDAPDMSPEPTDSPALFTFVNEGPLDAAGIGGNMTVNGVTITTQDVIGLDGTRASDGTGNETNIGNTDGLGINSAVSDTARNFEPGEGWEFTFNTAVQLQNIDLLLTDAGGTLTISSESFPDIVLAGVLEGDNDLGNTVVPANSLVSISYSHTDPEADGPRIISLLVAEVEADDCMLGDVNRDGIVNFLDISPFIGALTGGEISCEADVDQNGVVNFLDISRFILLLSGG